MTDATARANCTKEYPSEVVYDAVQNAQEGEDLTSVVDRAWGALGIHDATVAVADLLPLAAWALLSGAPEELVTFGEREPLR